MIRPVAAADIPALAALNDAEAQHVNALGEDGLRALLGAAWLALCAEGALLVALREDTPAQGPNHAWFQARLPAFALEGQKDLLDRVAHAASPGRPAATQSFQPLRRRSQAGHSPQPWPQS